jgi:hypothetical protein
MRLTDLDPHWVAEMGAPDTHQQGVSFLCPCCRTVRLAVFFAEPITGSPVDLKQLHRSQGVDGHLADHHLGSTLWTRTGEDFDTLSLTPSVDCSHFGHWHGYITNGAVA